MTTAAKSDMRVITSQEDLRSQSWPTGTVVQEIHTGNCCQEHEFLCDLHPPQWEKVEGDGWIRSGRDYDPTHAEPRLPAQLLWQPSPSRAATPLGARRRRRTAPVDQVTLIA